MCVSLRVIGWERVQLAEKIRGHSIGSFISTGISGHGDLGFVKGTHKSSLRLGSNKPSGQI